MSGFVEDASTLSFGDEFLSDDIQMLSNSQVAVFLTQTKENEEASLGEDAHEVLKKTLRYASRYSAQKQSEKSNEEIMTELDNLQEGLQTQILTTIGASVGSSISSNLGSGGAAFADKLHPFEVSALMNLMATDSQHEEALALIPSLSRFTESDIDKLLQLVSKSTQRIIT
jgi:DNA-directed RNA polymerase II subunit RPB4